MQFIIKHDWKDVFRFAPIQSAIGEEIVRHLGVDTTKIDSILLYEPGKGHYYKSEAAIRIARALGRIYSVGGCGRRLLGSYFTSDLRISFALLKVAKQLSSG